MSTIFKRWNALFLPPNKDINNFEMLKRRCSLLQMHIFTESKSSHQHASSACNNTAAAGSHLASAQLHNVIPITITKGAILWDDKGCQYLDFISGMGALILGHSHSALVQAMQEQCRRLTLTTRALQTSQLFQLTDYMAKLFNFEKILILNTDKVEACETSLKLARLWGYIEKKIPSNEAKILLACDNRWGTSFAAMSSSSDKTPYQLLGPFLPGFDFIPFNDLPQLEEHLKDPNVCAFMIEPIQGAAGFIVPDECYLAKAQQLCQKNKVLMIVDEVQTGLGITGSRLCVDYDKIKPDVLILGKALSGGMMPVSAVLADEHIMSLLKSEMHGSTFGANPLACHVARAALQVLEKEKLWENAHSLGEILRTELCKLPPELVLEVHGKGLLNGLLLNTDTVKKDVALRLAKKGVLARLHRGNFLSLIPPLIINEFQILTASNIIKEALCTFINQDHQS